MERKAVIHESSPPRTRFDALWRKKGGKKGEKEKKSQRTYATEASGSATSPAVLLGQLAMLKLVKANDRLSFRTLSPSKAWQVEFQLNMLFTFTETVPCGLLGVGVHIDCADC